MLPQTGGIRGRSGHTILESLEARARSEQEWHSICSQKLGSVVMS